jgi:putative Holliday junction resolvase
VTALITTGALDMRDWLPDGGGLIGLDLGTQTIGTAFCDPDWRIASPARPSRGANSPSTRH